MICPVSISKNEAAILNFKNKIKHQGKEAGREKREEDIMEEERKENKRKR